MNFLLRTPFFRLLLALIAGIVTSRYFRLYDLTLLVLAATAIVVVVLSFVINDVRWSYRLRWGFGAGVVLLVYLAGYLLAQRSETNLRFDFSDKARVYLLQIDGQPEVKVRSVVCSAVAYPCTDSMVAYSTDPVKFPAWLRAAFGVNVVPPGVLVYFQKDSASLALRRGDRVLARLHFQRPATVQNPEGFDYAGYLRTKGIAATAYVDSLHWQWRSTYHPTSIIHWAEKARNALLGVFRRLELQADDFAVLAALTLGYKDELDPEIMAHYSASGAMHVLSVSGLHVGVIYLIVNSLLSLMFRRPSLVVPKTVLMVLMLWGYAFITGLSPSVVRASSMFSLVAIGKALERNAQLYNTISSTGFILLLFNPSYLYDVGFQLSYTAVIGIVYFQPKIATLLSVRNKALKWMWDLTSVSLAAQIGTLPLSLYYFNQFPNYFLLTNYIAIPLSTLIIYSAVAFLAVSYLPIAGDASGWILRKLLSLLNASIEMIHDLPGSVLQVYAGPFELAVMILFIVCFIGYTELKKYLFIPVALVTLLIFTGAKISSGVQNLQTERLIYFSDRKESHLLLSAGRSQWSHTTDSSTFVRIASKYSLKHHLNKQSFTLHSGTFHTTFNGKRVLVVNDSTFRNTKAARPLEVDYLIVQQFSRQRVENFMHLFHARKVIIGAGVSDYYTKKFEEWCRLQGIYFYTVAQSGAYVEVRRMSN
jgi:competence protein ComEC